MKRSLVLLAAALLTGAAGARAQAAAQPGWDPGRVQLNRNDLQALLASYEQAATSPAHSDRYRAQARARAESIRARLQEGDVQPGDEVVLLVEGQAALTDTFTVREGTVLFLPQIGDVPLHGLLRSEVEGRLREHLSRYLRNPVVRARPLVRVSVEGEVRNPGWYVVPADALVSDVLMLAGGPQGNTSTARLRIERGGTPVWSGPILSEALAQGRTLDAMGIHPGDRFYLPAKPTSPVGAAVRSIPVLLSLVFAASQL
ncbi:polysaccharide biosynthesis/export family protein [Longimicrobium sp.]|uniref:polysaccharide biosynthesis/export family protein n=1 Tax=Longimicrobium sp. TaxID=2029185 RepID=UPI002BDC8D2F|nr:polysaccharide biosynthesis/export family protein [Longimicrobium sp.]HSU13069.1 polysaccharide biosynthesis/export family protein [Longimicrobium sp.]